MKNKLIYTSFSPNTRREDLKLNTRTLFQPWTWKDGNSGEKIRAWFESNYKGYNCTTYNYARAGMFALFKALRKTHNKIVIQGFTCVAAVNPARWAGLEVVFSDINKSTLNIDPKTVRSIDKDTVVLFQHTFGNSQGVERIQKLCKEKGALLVEDCTNTVLGKHGNKLIGTFGAASIFSFGRDKAISGVNGGAILVKEPTLAAKIEKKNRELQAPSTGWIFKELLHPLIWNKIKKRNLSGSGKAIHAIATKLGLLTKATTKTEKVGERPKDIPARLPEALARLAHFQLETIHGFNQHRKAIHNNYVRNLKTQREVKLISFEDGNIPLRTPVLVNKRGELVKFMRSKNVFLGDWYETPVAPKGTNLAAVGYKSGCCKASEEVCKQIVNLPTHINTSKEDSDKIISLIKRFYE